MGQPAPGCGNEGFSSGSVLDFSRLSGNAGEGDGEFKFTKWRKRQTFSQGKNCG